MKLFTGGPRADDPRVARAAADVRAAQQLERDNPHMPGLAGYRKTAEHRLSQAEIEASFYGNDDDSYNGGSYLLGGYD